MLAVLDAALHWGVNAAYEHGMLRRASEPRC